MRFFLQVRRKRLLIHLRAHTFNAALSKQNENEIERRKKVALTMYMGCEELAGKKKERMKSLQEKNAIRVSHQSSTHSRAKQKKTAKQRKKPERKTTTTKHEARRIESEKRKKKMEIYSK